MQSEGQAQTGGLDRFEEVYRQTAGFVRSAVYLISGEKDLDDIVQETYIKVWRNLPHFEGRSSLRTWVYRIAVNTARDHWRRQSRRQETTVAVMPDQGQAPADTDTAEEIRRGLASLSLEHREAFVLHYYEGFTLREIGEAAGCSEGTVKSRLHYARRALQDYLKARGISW